MKKYLKNFNKRIIKTINLGSSRRPNVPFSASVSRKQSMYKSTQSPQRSASQMSGSLQKKFVPTMKYHTRVNSPLEHEGLSMAKSRKKEFSSPVSGEHNHLN